MTFDLKIHHRFAEYDKDNKLLKKSVRLINNMYTKKRQSIPDGATVYLNINGLNNIIEMSCLSKDRIKMQITLNDC